MGEIPAPPESTVLLVEVGSTAHGTGIPGGEDHDELAIYVEALNEVLTREQSKIRMYRTQPEGVQSGPGDTDRTVYPLRQYLSLALKGNPSILLALWAPKLILPIGDEWPMAYWGDELRRIRQAFIGRHMVPRYRGYMQGQVQRILGTKGGGHGRRGGGGRSELIEEFGFDVKYAMHAARLGHQCVELLITGGLELPIPGVAGHWLRALRRGEVSFEDWWEEVLKLDKALEVLEGAVNYREGPDRQVVDKFSREAHLACWGMSPAVQE